MAEYLDMALDEIIRNKKQLRGPTNGPLRGTANLGSPGPARRLPSRNFARAVPYAPRPLMPMLSPILEEQRLIDAGADSESGVKLYISNLDYGVTNHDIMLLFSDIGDLKRYGIHCDRSGRSKGTAEVVFTRKTNAIAAIKRFNNVKLDGKPMHIENVGGQPLTTAAAAAPPLPPPYWNSILGQPPSFFASGGPMFGARGSFQDGGGGGVPWAKKVQAAAKPRQKKPSAKDLDADLERYRLEGLRIK